MSTHSDYSDRAETHIGRVHMSVYVDRDIFDAEMARIFHESWVYIAHESELPQPGSYKTTHIGQAPIIVTRDADGQLNAFANRCLHRGVTVCTRESGHAKAFRCPYHAWTYNLQGSRIGAKPDGYASEEFDRIPRRLAPVGRIQSYRGLIFARLAEEGPTLDEFLGNAKPYLDDWCELSPTGTRALESGVYKHTYKGNWKLQLEGANEGYHVDFLHRVVRAWAQKKGEQPLSLFSGSDARGIDLGNGHSLMETPVPAEFWKNYPPDYIAQLENRLGRERMIRVLNQNWRLTLFPNIAFASDNLRVIRPLSVDTTEVWQYHVARPAAPDVVNQAIIKLHETLYGSAGTAGPDDLEVFERMQEGYRSLSMSPQDAWVWLNKGITTEELRADGTRVGHTSSEIMQRAIYHAWKSLMTPPERRQASGVQGKRSAESKRASA